MLQLYLKLDRRVSKRVTSPPQSPFRCHERNGSKRRTGGGQNRTVAGNEPGNSEIEQNDISGGPIGRKKYIGRLDVPVHDGAGMGPFQRLRDGLEHRDRFVHGQTSSGCKEFVEALAFEQFHDDVGTSVVESAPGVDLRNVRMRQTKYDRGFSFESASDGALGQVFAMQDFDGDGVSGVFMKCAINRAEATTSDFGIDVVVTNATIRLGHGELQSFVVEWIHHEESFVMHPNPPMGKEWREAGRLPQTSCKHKWAHSDCLSTAYFGPPSQTPLKLAILLSIWHSCQACGGALSSTTT